MRSRSSPSWTTGLAAILLGAAVTVFVVLFAIVLTADHQPNAVVAYIAAVFQVLCLVQLSYVAYRETRQEQSFSMMSTQRRKPSLLDLNVAVAALLSVLAEGTSFAAFVWSKILLPRLPSHVLGGDTWTLLLCAIVVCGLSLLAKLIFFVTISWNRRRRAVEDLSGSPASAQDSHEMVEDSRPGTAQTAQSNLFHSLPDSTPSGSPRTSETLNSLRSSLTIAIRPATSKTKLITRPHSQRDSSSISRPSTSRQSQDSGFDTWDTTEVTPQIRETVLRSSPTTLRGTGLSPIPGSRSPSPAKALEGPFFLPTSPLESLPSSAPQSPLPTNFSRSGSRPGSRPGMRRRSASNEDHIHPLFRSSSPTPPPTAMPGTIVTAAPFAGLLINERTLSRMRSGSLPSSPLARADNFGAEDMFRSPTPPSRDITPPIPDFILSAGARSSIKGYGKRRAPELTDDGYAGQESSMPAAR
ncbi:hypothetical protein MMC24_004462 [Lignoscripta atroalba]|nr:hypothetical protein [Lignoscripta atroalba]